MPGTMPGRIAKGYIIHKLQAALNDLEKRATLRERLAARNADRSHTETVLEIFADPMLDLRKEDLDHLKKHWFNTAKSYWPGHQPVEIVVRHGLILAIDVASDAPQELPMDLYWICTGNQFEVSSLESDHQVTVLFLTPAPPVPNRIPDPNANVAERIYTARPTSRMEGEDMVKLEEDFVEFVRPRGEAP